MQDERIDPERYEFDAVTDRMQNPGQATKEHAEDALVGEEIGHVRDVKDQRNSTIRSSPEEKKDKAIKEQAKTPEKADQSDTFRQIRQIQEEERRRREERKRRAAEHVHTR